MINGSLSAVSFLRTTRLRGF